MCNYKRHLEAFNARRRRRIDHNEDTYDYDHDNIGNSVVERINLPRYSAQHFDPPPPYSNVSWLNFFLNEGIK